MRWFRNRLRSLAGLLVKCQEIWRSGCWSAGGAEVGETLAVRIPDVSYVRSGDVAIAYQVVGDGSPDIVFVRGVTGDLRSTWDQPLLVRHVEGLAECGRLLMLDKRGTGLSDRVREVHSAETAMDDIRAVMDAARSERAVIWLGAATRLKKPRSGSATTELSLSPTDLSSDSTLAQAKLHRSPARLGLP